MTNDHSASADQPNLKRQRGTAKAPVTRLATQIGQAMAQNKRDDTRERLAALDAVMTKSCDAHERYHVTLDDEEDIDVSQCYQSSVVCDMKELECRVKTWLSEKQSQDEMVRLTEKETATSSLQRILAEIKERRDERSQEKRKISRLIMEQENRLRKELQLQPFQTQEQTQASEIENQAKGRQLAEGWSTLTSSQPPTPTASESSVAQLLELSRQQHQAQVDSMQLPPVDLIKFDGNPLKYWQLMHLFATNVEKDTVPDEEKLTRLHHYTTGHARSAIAHCLYHPVSSVGYAQAMATLKKRFSSPYTISQA